MMLDDLRDQASFQPKETAPLPSGPTQPLKTTNRRQPTGRKGGLTAPQAFVLSLLVLVMTCVAGIVFLVAMGRFVFPF